MWLPFLRALGSGASSLALTSGLGGDPSTLLPSQRSLCPATGSSGREVWGVGLSLHRGVTPPGWRCPGPTLDLPPPSFPASLPLSLPPSLSFPLNSVSLMPSLCLKRSSKEGAYSKELRLFSVPNTRCSGSLDGASEAGGLGRACGSMAKASCCVLCHLWLEVGASYYFGALPWEAVCRV